MKKLCIGILAFLSFSPLFAQQTEKSIVVRSSSGVEAAADLPEGMLSETDSLYLDWISKNYINLGENCTATSTNPEVSDSIYMDRLQRIPAIMKCRITKWCANLSTCMLPACDRRLHSC